MCQLCKQASTATLNFLSGNILADLNFWKEFKDE